MGLGYAKVRVLSERGLKRKTPGPFGCGGYVDEGGADSDDRRARTNKEVEDYDAAENTSDGRWFEGDRQSGIELRGSGGGVHEDWV